MNLFYNGNEEQCTGKLRIVIVKKQLYQIIRKVVKVLSNSIMHHEAFTVVFWRAEDNSHCMGNRQINLAHAHFRNSWSGYPILMFENHAMINPIIHKFSKSLHKPLIKDFIFCVRLFLVSLPLSYQMIKERYEIVFLFYPES